MLHFCFICALFNPWWWTAVSAILLFWSGPFTPAIPLQIGLAVALKKFADFIKRRIKRRKDKNDSSAGDITTTENSETDKK